MTRAQQIVRALVEADDDDELKDFLLSDPSPDVLKAFAQQLFDDEVYDEIEGLASWPKAKHRLSDEDFGDEDIQCGKCTNGARLVAQRFGGKVYGYNCAENPEATVGTMCSGHDFAVVGDYIVDYWAHHFSGETDVAVIPVRSPEARTFYGPRGSWKLMYDYTRDDPRAYADPEIRFYTDG